MQKINQLQDSLKNNESQCNLKISELQQAMKVKELQYEYDLKIAKLQNNSTLIQTPSALNNQLQNESADSSL